MRRVVTVGGVVALALLSGTVVAVAQSPAPADCAPVGSSGAAASGTERPGLVQVTPPGSVPAQESVAQDPEPVEPEVPPVDVPPVDVPPVDAPPVEAPPADEPPADVPPADAPAGDVPPADAEPADVAPVDVPGVAVPADLPALDVPAEDPVADVPAADVPAADVPAADPAAADIPPADVPAADVPASDEPADAPAPVEPPVDVPAGDVPAGDVAAAVEPPAAAPADVPAAGVPAVDVPAVDVPAVPVPAAGVPAAAGPAVTGAGTPAAGVPAVAPGAVAPAPGDSCEVVGAATSAAVTLGWGEPTAVEEFDAPLGDSWNVYSGTGFGGQGRRTADALTLSDGVLTITGDAQGATGGIAWTSGQLYGRWEGRMRAPVGSESYNPLLLLWPDADNFPVGGEIDFVDMQDPTRQTTNVFVHHGADNQQLSGEAEIDATEWHNWAVEWTPTHIATFVDGVEWWRTEDATVIPRGPMHLCVQLDYFPTGDPVEATTMEVAWVRQYAADVSAPPEDPADPVVPTMRDGADDSPSDDQDSADASSDDGDSDNGDASDDSSSDDGDSGDASSDDGNDDSGDSDSGDSDSGDSDSGDSGDGDSDGGSEGLIDVAPAATGGTLTEGAPDDVNRRGLVGQAVPAP